MTEYAYTTHTFPAPDTGIGQSLGFADDRAFLEHQRAEEAKLAPEVQQALRDVRAATLREFLGL